MAAHEETQGVDINADISKIEGNAPTELKEHVTRLFKLFRREGAGFANSVGERVKITYVDLEEIGSKKRLQSKVVCKCTVMKDMVNGGYNLHGGCAGFLVDICSSIPIAVVTRYKGGHGTSGVTQSINMVYHAPAPVGTELEIISTTLAAGGRTTSARCELWDVKNKRLVASGVHVKMESSPSPKL